jgi:hypothetical protein
MQTANRFWNWFKENNEKYLYLDTINSSEREMLLDELLKELHNYIDKLFFQIGENNEGKKELIITAEGNKNYFDQVEHFVANAPKLEKWDIIALKPARKGNFITNYEGISINTVNTWFLALENGANPYTIGLRICTPDFKTEDERKFLFAAFEALDSLLGEKTNALNIQYVEVALLPDQPAKQGLIELSELPNYIQWKKTNQSFS